MVGIFISNNTIIVKWYGILKEVEDPGVKELLDNKTVTEIKGSILIIL